jgi:hypothetical protein
MIMPPGLRKFALLVHIMTSVGWIGAVVAYIPLDVTTRISQDAETLRAVYLGMELIAQWAIVPLAWAAFVTGLIVSLGTPWGLFRHYWVLISLLLTAVALLVLRSEMRTISALARIAADPTTSDTALRALPSTLVHSVGGLIVLLVVLGLNVYKPRGLTPYGWRKQQEQRRALQRSKQDEQRTVSQL